MLSDLAAVGLPPEPARAAARTRLGAEGPQTPIDDSFKRYKNQIGSIQGFASCARV